MSHIDSDSDSDTLSVATDFTQASVIHPGQEYDADCILAEIPYSDTDEGPAIEYLVKWAGYDYDRCTWEPQENCDQSLLSAWLHTKQAGADNFDLDAWNERELLLREERIRRRKRRNRKRIAKGLNPWPCEIQGTYYEPDPEDSAFEPEEAPASSPTHEAPASTAKRSRVFVPSDDDSEDDMPIVMRKRRKASPDKPLPLLQTRRSASPSKRSKPAHKASDSATTTPLKEHANLFAFLKPAVRRDPDSQRPAPPPRGATFPGARRNLAPNVFDGASASKPTSKRSVDGRSRRGRPGLHTHLSFRHAANKVREKAPLHMPRLTELDTGKAVPAATTSSFDADRPIPSSVPVSAPAISNTRRGSSSGEDDEEDSTLRPSGRLTCWFWGHRSYCPDESLCSFEHSAGYPVAGFENRLTKQQLTCYFWATLGMCKNSVDNCAYSHHLTAYVAHPGKPPIRVTPEIEDSIRKKTEKYRPGPSSTAQGAFTRPPSSSEGLGCWYYHMTPQGCRKSNRDCRFSHELVDWVAAGSVKGAPIWVGQISGPNKTSPARKVQTGLDHENTDRQSSPPLITASTTTSSSPSPRVRREEPREIVLPYVQTQRPQPVYNDHPPQHISESEISGLIVKMTFRLIMPDVEINARLNGLTPTQQTEDVIAACRSMEFTQMLIKPFVRAQLGGVSTLSTPSDLSSKAVSRLEAVKCKLVEANAAAIFSTDACTILIFPNRHDWQFLDPGAGRSDGSLRFQLFKPLIVKSTEATIPTTKIAAIDKMSLARNAFAAIDLVQLFALSSGIGAKEERRNVFLMFSGTKRVEMDAFAAILSEKGANVFHSSMPGSWAHFRHLATSLSKSIVVFSNEIENFDRIPALREMLKFSSVDAFRLCPGKSINYPGGSIVSTQARISRLFPRGRVVLLMDDCFEEDPEDTLEVVEYFAKRANNPDYGKIIGAPNLLDRLMDPGQGDDTTDRELLAKSWQLLTDIRDKSLQEHGELLSDSDILTFFCPTDESLPGYTTKWQSRDPAQQAGASHILAFWFNFWASSHADQWRRFVLVTSARRDMRTEMQSLYRHITVLNPSNYIRFEEAIEKNKASQGRGGDHKRPVVQVASLSGTTGLRSTLSSPSATTPNTGLPTPVDVRLTPRSTPRSPDAAPETETVASPKTGQTVDPRLKMRKENQQKYSGVFSM